MAAGLFCDVKVCEVSRAEDRHVDGVARCDSDAVVVAVQAQHGRLGQRDLTPAGGERLQGAHELHCSVADAKLRLADAADERDLLLRVLRQAAADVNLQRRVVRGHPQHHPGVVQNLVPRRSVAQHRLLLAGSALLLLQQLVAVVLAATLGSPEKQRNIHALLRPRRHSQIATRRKQRATPQRQRKLALLVRMRTCFLCDSFIKIAGVCV